VAVRDGNAIDYADYQNTILTDLLLTSSLKGYIDRPGFYLAEQTPERQQMLDNLLLIRGWHKYNVSDEIGTTIFRPPYLPEHQLTIYGRVHSWYEKMQPGVGISLIAENDTQKMNYNATADSQGYFSFPVNDFNGSIETYFQMQRPNKNANRHTFLYLFRHFEPSIRAYDPWETTLRWDQPKLAAGLQQPAMPTTEFYGRTLYFFFNIREFLDRQYEGGKVMATDVPASRPLPEYRHPCGGGRHRKQCLRNMEHAAQDVHQVQCERSAYHRTADTRLRGHGGDGDALL
jgi:hypothetical protein